jgi:hypothetical protein
MPHTLQIHIDHPIPLLDLKKLEARARHEAGVVEHDINAPVCLHSMTDQTLDLLALRDIGPNDGFLVEPKLACERLKSVDAPSAKHELGSVPGEMASRGFSEAAARAGDDDNLVFHPFGHGIPLFLASSLRPF